MKRNGNLTSSPLRAWADYLAWVSTTGDFQVVAGSHQCTVVLPDGHVLKVQASSPDLLARKIMAELTSNLVGPPHVAVTAEPFRVSSVQDVPQKEVSMQRHYEPAIPHASHALRSVPVTSTKDALQTVGVYVPVAMHVELKSLAKRQGKKFAVLIRELVSGGYERFEEAIEDRSPRKVLDGYEQKVAIYTGESQQWMARLDRTLSLELKLTAKEYGRSASQIVGGLLAEELSHCLQAKGAIVGAEVEVERARLAIAEVVGPRATELADYLGLHGKRRLVNEVLGGLVRAPGALLGKIAEYFAVSREAVAQAVGLNFRQMPTPSYKAPNGQPRMLTEPVPWEDAVKALRLPRDEEAKLLAIGD